MMLADPNLVSEMNRQEGSFRELGRDFKTDFIEFLHHDAPKLLFILVMAFVLHRIVTFFVERMKTLAARQVGNTQRAAQLRTLASLTRATSYGVIGFIVLLQILPLFNIDLKPLLASAGVVGLGISFGAQSIFKDMLNGVFIFLENQFNVGDVVKLAGLQGTVEDMSLRSTTLRDGDGTQYFIPNSQIATVSNLSREYSVASLPVAVDSSANPDQIISVLREIASELRADKAFADVVIADPDILGVDKINGREVIYPVNIRVRANQKDPVLRALRRRVLLRFERESIPLGVSTTLVLGHTPDPTAPPTIPMPGSAS